MSNPVIQFTTRAFATACLAIPTLLMAAPAAAQGSGNSNVRLTDDDFETHIGKLRKRLPEGDFRIQIERPFVVISDESSEMLQRRCKTIRWAINRLKTRYFEHNPDHIIDIWLFKDKGSYETNVEALFDETPGTPFGYYSSRHRALVMNISTGGGTLIHELVHPFIERNFPECPSWFNEGLASLYEQCGDEDGKIHGYTNWRLNGLQRFVAGDSLPKFKSLCETTTNEFYREDPGSNYAQARYLCYYLQQSRLLKKFYHDFVANADKDPSGFQTLVEVLGDPDMDDFQDEWQRWVMKLKFR